MAQIGTKAQIQMRHFDQTLCCILLAASFIIVVIDINYHLDYSAGCDTKNPMKVN